MIAAILDFASKNIARGKKVALVTVTATRGSSPASAGQLMAVLADGSSSGTVGGGASEHKIIRMAVEAIGSGESVFSFELDHSESGMVCGGGMSGFGNILGNENHLYIFGGGHVAQNLAPIAAATGFYVTVIEDRAELADSFPGGMDFIAVSSPEEYKARVPLTGLAYAVICTRGHSGDLDALRFCLDRPFRYIGMIGSARKVAETRDALRAEGVGGKLPDNVYAPVGLDIASSVPAEIAVSILAELLLVKNGGSPRHKRII